MVGRLLTSGAVAAVLWLLAPEAVNAAPALSVPPTAETDASALLQPVRDFRASGPFIRQGGGGGGGFRGGPPMGGGGGGFRNGPSMGGGGGAFRSGGGSFRAEGFRPRSNGGFVFRDGGGRDFSPRPRSRDFGGGFDRPGNRGRGFVTGPGRGEGRPWIGRPGRPWAGHPGRPPSAGHPGRPHGGKHRHRRHRYARGFYWGPSYDYYYPGYYYGDVEDCRWLREQALSTASLYWWNRYREYCE